MKLKFNKFNIFIFFSAIFFVGIDQIIKYIVSSNMQLSQSIPIIYDVLHITYVLNDGAAFSFMSGQSWLLCGVTSVVMIALVLFLFYEKLTNKLAVISVGMIISGGIGNLIDRIFKGDTLFHGKVVDFIDFRLINFAVFNFADCLVVVGTILFAVYLIFFDKEFFKENIKEENC